jgi:hypothetical protein
MKNYPLTQADAAQSGSMTVKNLLQWERKFNSKPLLFILSILITASFGKLSAQCNLNCIQNVQVAINESGIAEITPNVLLTQYPVPGCSTNIAIEIKDGNGKLYPTTLTCNELGMTFNVKVTDLSNGNFCSSKLALIDQIKPQITPINLTMFCSDPKSPDLVGYPTVADNCGPISSDKLNYTDTYVDLPCKTLINGQEITGQVIRTWSVTDKSGNLTSAVQIISLKRAKISDIVFPPDLDGIKAPKLDCSADPTDMKKTGVPTINGFSIVNGASCELFVQHADNVYNTCVNGSYSILRTWTVVDYCVDSFKVYVQVIRREDINAPVMVVPKDITVGTQSNSCTAIVNLPSTTATDNCSNFTIKPLWQFGQGYGPFYNVPVGKHLVTYTSTDDCGNSSTVTMNVTVIDEAIPVAVCKKDLAIAMDDDGIVTANASLFDDGSFDNCSIQKIEVRRGNDPYSSSLTFTCNDISNQPVNVELRVFDTSNLSNTCSVKVFVSDPVSPVVTCPADITLSCIANANDLSIAGQASATDNCSVPTITFVDTKNLNSCNQGTITRKWRAIDKYNNFTECSQKITLQDQTPLNITWPSDYATNVCGAVVSPDKTGTPSFTNNDCEQLDVNYTDQVFNTAPPACYKIVRKWVVRNWCVYNPNIPDVGIWEKNQVIEVNDVVAPVLSIPSDITVGTTSTTACVANVVVPSATATDCNPNVSIVNNSGYALLKNSNASGTYPSGVHTITFTAYDGCGNSTSASMKITVVDDEPPIPACIKGLSIPLNSDGIATVTLNMIEIGTTDNCTPKSSIKFDLFPTSFNCLNIGDNQVTLMATDAAGNSNFCITNVNIQDNIGYCSQVVKIAGKVTSILGEEMKDVQVLLNNELERITPENGKYEYTDLFKNTDYYITASKQSHILSGISTQDALALSKHILGIKALDSPYKIIAADINNNGKVTTADLLALRRAILQLDDKFPNNTSWRLVDANHVFPNPANPFTQIIPEKITFDKLQTNKTDVNWVGIKVGDLNVSVNPNNAIATTVRNSSGTLELTTDDIQLSAGYEYRIPIKSSDFQNVQGFQYTLEYDAHNLEIMTVLPGALKTMDENAIGNAFANEGKTGVSWIEPIQGNFEPNDVLFELVVKAKSNTLLSKTLSIGSTFLTAEAYNKQDEILDVALKFNNNVASFDFDLEQNMPNPFEFETSIPFTLASASEVNIEIFDMLGNKIKTINGLFPQGNNLIKVTSSDLNNLSGMYYYQLQVKGKRKLTRKMILMHE